MSKICPHCGIKHQGGTSFGAHVRNCIKNPKRAEIINKIKKSNTIEQKIYTFKCAYCNKEYKLKLKVTDYSKGKYKKHCSKSCASSNRTKSIETKEKISKSLKEYNKNNNNKKIQYCVKCNKPFNRNRKRKYNMCNKCVRQSTKYRLNLSNSLKGVNAGSKNGMFGKCPPHTKKIKIENAKKELNTSSFYIRSTYEKEYVYILENDNNVKWYKYEPQEYKCTYIIDEKIKTYFPDFLVHYKDNTEKIIEVKAGWMINDKITKIKERAFKNMFDINYEYWTKLKK